MLDPLEMKAPKEQNQVYFRVIILDAFIIALFSVIIGTILFYLFMSKPNLSTHQSNPIAAIFAIIGIICTIFFGSFGISLIVVNFLTMAIEISTRFTLAKLFFRKSVFKNENKFLRKAFFRFIFSTIFAVSILSAVLPLL